MTIAEAGAGRHLRFEQLAELLTAILRRHGASDATSAILARNCAMAERDGAKSHGLYRMAGYVANLKSGFVNGMAVPVIQQKGAAFLYADAGNGYARPAMEMALDRAVAMTKDAGACVLAIGNAHHNGPLSLDVEPFAQEGLVALTMVNSVTYVVPHGASKPLFGTNPMAFAAPRSNGRVLLFDQASAAMANGEVRIAAKRGEQLPDNVGLDRYGKPTRSPHAVLDGGSLLPFGGHKGSSIAMMIDLLSGALTGSNFSYQVDWSNHPGAESAHTGQLFILIDPTKGAGALELFRGRVDDLLSAMMQAGQTRFPGERRYAARRHAEARGIFVEAERWEQLQTLLS